MNDYISRKDAIDRVKMDCFSVFTPLERTCEINDIPAADVISVVFCKDCKYVQKFRSEESAKKFGQVYECLKYTIPCPNPTDFCSYGERKE